LRVVGLNVEIFIGLFDDVLDGVPSHVRVWHMANQHKCASAGELR
jgi:hypothetical protein